MKGQSAIEFISVYGFMLIIASLFIALVVLFAFSAQNSIQTSQCSGFSGFYCSSAQVVYNAVARNSLVFLALDTEQSAPVNVIGINVIIDNGTYAGTCLPAVAVPTSPIDCIIGVNSITRVGQQVIGSYSINGQYCNSPLYRVTVENCTYQNVTYAGSFSTFVSNHLSLGYGNPPVAPTVVGAVSGSLYTPWSIAMAPSGAYAYVPETFGSSSGYGDIAVISTSTNSITNRFGAGSFEFPMDAPIAPAGSYAYVTNEGFTGVPYIDAISTSTGSELYQITLTNLWPQSLAFSPSGSYAYMLGSSNVLVLNPSTRQITGSINSQAFNTPLAIAFAPNGAYAYVTNSGGNNVLVINTATGTVSNSITSATFQNIDTLTVSPDGAYLYVGSSNKIFIISTATGKIVDMFTSGLDNPTGMAFTPSGSLLYVVNYNSGNVIIVNPGTYK